MPPAAKSAVPGREVYGLQYDKSQSIRGRVRFELRVLVAARAATAPPPFRGTRHNRNTRKWDWLSISYRASVLGYQKGRKTWNAPGWPWPQARVRRRVEGAKRRTKAPVVEELIRLRLRGRVRLPTFNIPVAQTGSRQNIEP